MKKKAIIFDLDGTLWDSIPCLVPAWNSVFERWPELDRRVSYADMASQMGHTMDRIIEVLVPKLTDEAQRKLLIDDLCAAERERLNRHGGMLYPDLREVLEELRKDYELYLVSNCEVGYLDAFLNAHQMREFFSDTECSERTGKPKAENIRLLMERNGVREAVYVGDTEIDRSASEQAGVPFIWVTYGFGIDVKAEWSIDSLRELPMAAAQVFR